MQSKLGIFFCSWLLGKACLKCGLLWWGEEEEADAMKQDTVALKDRGIARYRESVDSLTRGSFSELVQHTCALR